MRKLGFIAPTLDQATQGIFGYAAHRGREQQMIDFYGGIGSLLIANPIRGVRKNNPLGKLYHSQSDILFGPLAPYTGNP